MEYDEEDGGEFVLPHQAIGLWNPTVQMFDLGSGYRSFPDGKPARNQLNSWLDDNYDAIPVKSAERIRLWIRQSFGFGRIQAEGFVYTRTVVDWELSWKWVLLTCYQQLYDRLQGYIESFGVVPTPARWKRYLRRFFRKEFEARAEFEAKVTTLVLEAVVNRFLPVAVANEFLDQYGIPPLR